MFDGRIPEANRRIHRINCNVGQSIYFVTIFSLAIIITKFFRFALCSLQMGNLVRQELVVRLQLTGLPTMHNIAVSSLMANTYRETLRTAS